VAVFPLNLASRRLGGFVLLMFENIGLTADLSRNAPLAGDGFQN